MNIIKLDSVRLKMLKINEQSWTLKKPLINKYEQNKTQLGSIAHLILPIGYGYGDG